MIKNKDVPEEVLGFLRIPNEKYYMALKLGNSAFFYKPDEFLGTNEASPPGAAYWTKKITGKMMGLEEIKPIKNKTLPFKLREEQSPILKKMIGARHALIEFPTGGGKTVCMIAFYCLENSPMLIVVHAKAMVDQVYNEFKKFLGIKFEIGRYNTDHKDIKNTVTVTTFNSFSAKPELFNQFEVLIIDEADTYFTEKARKKICEHPAKRKFGFTGTVKTRSDEFKPKSEPIALEKFYGFKIKGEYNKQRVSKIFYKYYKKKYVDKYGIYFSPQSDWIRFRMALDSDMERKNTQLKFLEETIEKEDKALVLFDRVADVKLFYERWKNQRSYMIYGETKREDRERIKEEFLRDGGVLFAQYKTSSRGVDYPECNKLYLFFPIKNESALRQAVGRVIRFIEGKKSYVYDFVDHLLYFQWRRRKKTYEEYYKEAEIIEIE